MPSSGYLIDKYILNDIQTSYDPYDVWNTKLGMGTKKLYYWKKWMGALPAAALTLFDFYINNSFRVGYSKRNYPVVHAYRILIATDLYRKSSNPELLNAAKKSLTWLITNYSKGYSGYCWGANMPWVSKNGVYNKNTPFITNTPYVLEALLKYTKVSGDQSFSYIVPTIFEFIEKDLIQQISTHDELALSYSPRIEKRIVVNANAYAMYCYAIFYSLFPEKADYILNKIGRIFNFLKHQQQKDGSWLYYADDQPGNFIDCFHSCFVLKNLIKVNKIIHMNGSDAVINLGYQYIKENFFNTGNNLVRRFSKPDSVSLVKYDLYDNAEMLNLACLVDDMELVGLLNASIKKNFFRKNNIYSQIVFPYKRINKNTLRWAVMPFLYSLQKSNAQLS